ncbi:hypothetical protein QJS04_geneDACA001137 [Acorus gramineus]|uniref:Uncharacterized protein n=1 Tax=Acorus gramineus TaxID=55184 RepID=A0AAV9AE43_ACOGR|nr:hypothetical protein QJS04_geneDACA001137 [Acorus gramineus]
MRAGLHGIPHYHRIKETVRDGGPLKPFNGRVGVLHIKRDCDDIMRDLRRGALMAFLMLVALGLYSAAAAASDRAVVSVVGMGECADCVKKNADAFRGLRVAVKCKNNKEEYKTTAVAVLTENGKFSVDLPTSELIDTEGRGLKTECFAELRSASNKPCPSSNGLESSKIVLKSKEKHQHVYGTMGKLVFSKDTCAAAFLWKGPPYPWHKPFPKLTLPPLHHYSPMHKPHKPEYKPPFIYKKPPCPPLSHFKKPFKKPFPPLVKKPFPHFPPLVKKPYPYKYPPHYGFPPKPTHPKASGSKEMAPTKV